MSSEFDQDQVAVNFSSEDCGYAQIRGEQEPARPSFSVSSGGTVVFDCRFYEDAQCTAGIEQRECDILTALKEMRPKNEIMKFTFTRDGDETRYQFLYDTNTRIITSENGGESVDLTPREGNMFAAIARHPGEVMSYESLNRASYEGIDVTYMGESDDSVINRNISRINNKCIERFDFPLISKVRKDKRIPGNGGFYINTPQASN